MTEHRNCKNRQTSSTFQEAADEEAADVSDCQSVAEDSWTTVVHV